MFYLRENTMSDMNADQIRYRFLKAAYYELFGHNIDSDSLTPLSLEKNDDGQQKS